MRRPRLPRRYAVILLSAWPGLAQVWTGQEVLGLLLAAAFAAALNGAILARGLWVELVPPPGTDFLLLLAVGTWIAAVGYTAWWVWRCHPERHRESIEQLYREALEHYLAGRWTEARRRCEQVLTLNEQDADALFQLGLVLARSGRSDEARRALRGCLDLDGGAKWRWEVEQWLGRLEAAA